MHRRQPHLVVLASEIEHAQVADHAAQFVIPRCRLSRRCRPVVADPADRVDLGYEGPRRMPRHPVTDRVVDGVAWRAAYPEKRGLRTAEVPDRGNIDIAVDVDLARA